jgi:hypothetical protein
MNKRLCIATQNALSVCRRLEALFCFGFPEPRVVTGANNPSAGWVPLEISGVFFANVVKRSGILKDGGLEVTEPPLSGLIRANMRPLGAHNSDLGGEQALQTSDSATIFQMTELAFGKKSWNPASLTKGPQSHGLGWFSLLGTLLH